MSRSLLLGILVVLVGGGLVGTFTRRTTLVLPSALVQQPSIEASSSSYSSASNEEKSSVGATGGEASRSINATSVELLRKGNNPYDHIAARTEHSGSPLSGSFEKKAPIPQYNTSTTAGSEADTSPESAPQMSSSGSAPQNTSSQSSDDSSVHNDSIEQSGTVPFQIIQPLPLHTDSNNKTSHRVGTVRKKLLTSKNRTLVIVTGGLRGGEATWRSLYEHVLDVNQADLAVIVEESQLETNASLFQRADYLVTIPHYNDWADAMEDWIPDKPSDWRHEVFYNLTRSKGHWNIFLGGAGGNNNTHRIKGSGSIIFMFRWFVLQQAKQHQWTDHYDRFIVSRPDHFYACPHDISQLNPNYIWIPQGEDWRGICDRHIVANAQHLPHVLDLIAPVVQHPDRYKDILDPKVRINTEMFFKRRLEEEGLLSKVKRFPRTMFLAYTTQDAAGWKTASLASADDFAPNLMTRYSGELNETRQQCRAYREQHNLTTTRAMQA